MRALQWLAWLFVSLQVSFMSVPHVFHPETLARSQMAEAQTTSQTTQASLRPLIRCVTCYTHLHSTGQSKSYS